MLKKFLPLFSVQKYFYSNEIAAESILSPENASFLEGLEDNYIKNPQDVDENWSSFLTEMSKQKFSMTDFPLESSDLKPVAISLLRSFQQNGHYIAKIDPINHFSEFNLREDSDVAPFELNIKNYKFSEKDLDKKIQLSTPMVGGFQSASYPKISVKELHKKLKECYCGNTGYEFVHIQNLEARNWFREKIEITAQKEFSIEEKISILERLTSATEFERFIDKKFKSKRFGIEGGESLIPALQVLTDLAVDHYGVTDIVLGMPHRGRLNVLTNYIGKPLSCILAEFLEKDTVPFGIGDVKYHDGWTQENVINKFGKTVNFTLLPNSSHLESVNPIVQGKARAKQDKLGDYSREKILPITIHGDAAFSGQGVVFETLGFSNIKDFTTGGTIHVIVNNQIGYTAEPSESRLSRYCSDVAKAVHAPILHVNGDDVEAVVRSFLTALEWRQKFHKDVVIDMVCYRLNGHNELDEPSFTNPLMYKKIKQHPSVYALYVNKLTEEKSVSKKQIKDIKKKVEKFLKTEFQNVKDGNINCDKNLKDQEWKKMTPQNVPAIVRKTGLPEDVLVKIAECISHIPESFNLHPKLESIFQRRKECFNAKEGIDWAAGEALAFGSLILEGYNLRVCGQDSQRGTFSHRHSILHDQENGNKYCQLEHIYDFCSPLNENNHGKFSIVNSPLSELGVLGFEYGYSLESPNNINIFEGQFGDFVNNAQVIIDQYISAAESKWQRQSGIVLLLPHGYEGQGPEHSNGRMVRYLQLCDENPNIFPTTTEEKMIHLQHTNLQVVNITKPSNLFHALRRQVSRSFRKPLIIMTPKSLLRNPQAISSLSEFNEKSDFQPIIPDELKNDKKIRKIILCSGKIYYDLLEHRTKNSINDVVIIRVEQLCPFPFVELYEELKKYFSKVNNKENLPKIIWAQEEPENYGGWNHSYFRLKTVLKKLQIKEKYTIDIDDLIGCASRKPSGSPATGKLKYHLIEQKELIEKAFS